MNKLYASFLCRTQNSYAGDKVVEYAMSRTMCCSISIAITA